MEGEGHLVRDIMKKKLISIDETETIKKAASMMSEAKIGSIIITKDNIPVGILTERVLNGNV
jgi:CBS domain-containing protein